VTDDDSVYAPGRIVHAPMLLEGKISFRTCFKDARVPLSWLLKLASQEYGADKEPHSLMDAVHHWLLCKCLNVIGGHSRL
jgi:hypothetical protein